MGARRPTSRIYRNPDLEALVKDGLKRRLTYPAIRAECVAAFGRAAAPSCTAISRFYQSLPPGSLEIPENPT